IQAVTRTTASPERTTTAPFACLAILPVSSVIIRPPRSISTVWCIIFLKTSNLGRARLDEPPASHESATRERAPFETGVDRMGWPATRRGNTASTPFGPGWDQFGSRRKLGTLLGCFRQMD